MGRADPEAPTFAGAFVRLRPGVQRDDGYHETWATFYLAKSLPHFFFFFFHCLTQCRFLKSHRIPRKNNRKSGRIVTGSSSAKEGGSSEASRGRLGRSRRWMDYFYALITLRYGAMQWWTGFGSISSSSSDVEIAGMYVTSPMSFVKCHCLSY